MPFHTIECAAYPATTSSPHRSIDCHRPVYLSYNRHIDLRPVDAHRKCFSPGMHHRRLSVRSSIGTTHGQVIDAVPSMRVRLRLVCPGGNNYMGEIRLVPAMGPPLRDRNRRWRQTNRLVMGVDRVAHVAFDIPNNSNRPM